MTVTVNRIKAAIRKTPLFAPLKWLAALLGRSSYPLPFSCVLPAEPYLERAIARVGRAPDPDRRNEEFYSYFSEIWSDGYEQALVRQYTAYLPFLPKCSDLPFLDIGCGAGEFIQFLSAHGIHAQGIDINADEVARAKERGLNVYCADATCYLRENRGCFCGVSLLEVIEHIPTSSLPSLLSEIFQALSPGGAVLIETINVKHPLFSHNFYTDPTHARPIPSDLLAFLLQWHGFSAVQVIYTSPIAFTYEQSLDPTRAYSNYAVLAHKPMKPSC
ncbi:class I SAM-dependent methyltransferase [Acidithiobacillus caldus]|uniref:class I SAM-dependent methyltransferase n=1 Tax=Acidithiobacillus caldus TaxID=33059 RepID=UPI001C07A15F|nr:class I SAM-dependent methyltransferase [Acidithiobacillus caldus]MBU2803393.1 class I SAM-dependent methyltransferase [Acidithiobacillus caldus]